MDLNLLLTLPSKFHVLEEKLEGLISKFEQLQTQPPPNEIELLTRKQTAQLLGVSLVTLDLWKNEGLIPYERFGTRIRFDKREVLKSGKSLSKYKKGGV